MHGPNANLSPPSFALYSPFTPTTGSKDYLCLPVGATPAPEPPDGFGSPAPVPAAGGEDAVETGVLLSEDAPEGRPGEAMGEELPDDERETVEADEPDEEREPPDVDGASEAEDTEPDLDVPEGTSPA
ncbi:Midasin [Sphaceloma murrayae]|uniref:Midasin n=1 Tax=Sphaceloma murrayae TaxID=2082308 RepID=A0A2K1R0L3_9PEZI|nr:Midasin [Sphaceloma murrayae]